MGLFLHQLTVQGVVSPQARPPVAYNCCVSVFQACNARIEPTKLQLIDMDGYVLALFTLLFYVP